MEKPSEAVLAGPMQGLRESPKNSFGQVFGNSDITLPSSFVGGRLSKGIIISARGERCSFCSHSDAR